MAETKKAATATKKKNTTNKGTAKKTTQKSTVKSPAKKTATKAAVKSNVKNKPKTVTKKSDNFSNADQSFKLTKDAMFNVWVDALILVFIILMFVLILYGYIMSA